MDRDISISDAKTDPLFNAAWKLKIQQVLEFPEHASEKNYLCFQSHVFHKIEVCGKVISIEAGPRGTQFEIDDGTGLLPCIIWSQLGDIAEFCIGCCVAAEGKLNTGYNMRQLTVWRLEINQNPNVQAAFAIQAEKLMHDVYAKPWIISDEGNRDMDVAQDRNRQHLLFKYLQSKYELENEFSLEMLQHDVSLRELVGVDSTEGSSINQMADELVTLGLLFKKGSFSTTYGVVPRKRLKQHVMEALRHPAHQVGAKVEDIWQRIRWDRPEFVDIPKQSVTDALAELDEAGLIYECYHRMFKLSS